MLLLASFNSSPGPTWADLLWLLGILGAAVAGFVIVVVVVAVVSLRVERRLRGDELP